MAEGKNQSDAYRGAYPNSQKWKPDAVNNAGFKAMSNGDVLARVAELRAEASKKTVITLESHLAELERLRDLALDAGKFDAAINAEVHRGKARGRYVKNAAGKIGCRDRKFGQGSADSGEGPQCMIFRI